MYIKSPFNYIGGKYKLLPQIIPLFPKNINTFIDIFGGGFNVGINTTSKKVIYNDQITPLTELFQYFKNNTTENIINYIHTTIKENQLNKKDKANFNSFREKYNQTNKKHPLDLYILMCYSYNYQLRYNNQMEYNSSHGTNRSSYTKTMENRLKIFIEKLHKINTEFISIDFKDYHYQKLNSNDFVFFDPPYILSTGNYNDGNRGFKNWTPQNEKQLYKILKKLDEQDIGFGLTNLYEHKAKKNKYLSRFINNNNYIIIDLNTNYDNSSYNTKNKDNITREVYITNK